MGESSPVFTKISGFSKSPGTVSVNRTDPLRYSGGKEGGGGNPNLPSWNILIFCHRWVRVKSLWHFPSILSTTLTFTSGNIPEYTCQTKRNYSAVSGKLAEKTDPRTNQSKYPKQARIYGKTEVVTGHIFEQIVYVYNETFDWTTYYIAQWNAPI